MSNRRRKRARRSIGLHKLWLPAQLPSANTATAKDEERTPARELLLMHQPWNKVECRLTALQRAAARERRWQCVSDFHIATDVLLRYRMVQRHRSSAASITPWVLF